MAKINYKQVLLKENLSLEVLSEDIKWKAREIEKIEKNPIFRNKKNPSEFAPESQRKIDIYNKDIINAIYVYVEDLEDQKRAAEEEERRVQEERERLAAEEAERIRKEEEEKAEQERLAAEEAERIRKEEEEKNTPPPAPPKKKSFFDDFLGF